MVMRHNADQYYTQTCFQINTQNNPNQAVVCNLHTAHSVDYKNKQEFENPLLANVSTSIP